MKNKSGFRLGLVSGIISVFLLMSSLGSSCLGSSPTSVHQTNLATDLDEIESRLRATVAFIDPETDRIYCSGFFVSERQIISAGHCFETSVPFSLPDGQTLQLPSGLSTEGMEVALITYDDLDMATNRVLHDPVFATIVYHSPSDDVAILELNAPVRDSRYTFQFAEDSPRIGSAAYGIGHPYRLAWSFESGIISRVVRSPTSGEAILVQASVPVAGGNSGGPLIDAHGNIIGMALAFVDRMPHLSIFISAQQIQVHMRMHLIRQMIAAYEQQQNSTAPSEIREPPGAEK